MNKYVNDFTPTVQTYYKELRKYKPISRQDEIDLIKKAKNNNLNAKNKLLTANLRFVFDVAKRYKGNGVAIEDLISEGNLGLVKAIDKFDTNKDVKFISYAVWWIRQSIQEFIKKEQIKDNFETLDDDNNTNSDKLKDDDDFKDNESDSLLNKLIYNDETNTQLSSKQRIILNKLLGKLDSRAQFIIKAYYGFDSDDGQTLEEIGKKLNLSRERVRKIKEKNLRILRSELILNDEFSDLFI